MTAAKSSTPGVPSADWRVPSSQYLHGSCSLGMGPCEHCTPQPPKFQELPQCILFLPVVCGFCLLPATYRASLHEEGMERLNLRKRLCDIVLLSVPRYFISHKPNKTWQQVFWFAISIAVNNAYILYKMSDAYHVKRYSRAQFGERLVRELLGLEDASPAH